MKIIAVFLIALALADATPMRCFSSLPFLEICAYGGCFLSMDQHDLDLMNCDRALRGMPPLLFHAEGKCNEKLIPKCKTFNY